MLECFVWQNHKWVSLGVFEMAPGRDMDSKTLVPFGTYQQQAQKFSDNATREYGASTMLRSV